jgi:hypothetical protein
MQFKVKKKEVPAHPPLVGDGVGKDPKEAASWSDDNEAGPREPQLINLFMIPLDTRAKVVIVPPPPTAPCPLAARPPLAK